MRFIALRELLRRYGQVLSASWSVRKQLTPIERSDHKRAFLPTAPELQASPVPHRQICATWVKLNKSTMNIVGRRVKLAPGMAVIVEIKTGPRRIIEYFLSPLIQYAMEGLRER